MSKFKVYSSDSNGYSPPGYYKDPPSAFVDLQSEESIKKWQEVLKMTRSELVYAVEEFGPLIKNIRRGLRNRKNDAA
jgi:hypothetical protein